MISVAEASAQVLARSRPRHAVRLPLSQALGHVLAENVASDIDSPPYDKSLVDGYAVRSSDVQSSTELLVLEEVTAGAMPSQPVGSGQATRIMTGAPLPADADAVVMVEHTTLVRQADDSERVRIQDARAEAGQNIMRRATSMRRGQVVLETGCILRPIEIGLAAEVGAVELPVYPQPTVAVLSTGDELVTAGSQPAAGQIRNSNGPMLQAMVTRAGGRAVDLGIGRDVREELLRLVERGLNEDVLVLSGGVSAGVLDLVPSVLAELGVLKVFHKVHLKPGKPIWFGTRPDDQQGDRLVFGLPGNPVSSLVCFELFVRPALAAMAGRAAEGLSQRKATLAHDHLHRSDRPTYFPARWSETGGRSEVETLAWKGSADLCTLAQANCLVAFRPGERQFRGGEAVDVVVLSHP